MGRVTAFLALALMFSTSVFALGVISSAHTLGLYDGASPITAPPFASLNTSTCHIPGERLTINLAPVGLYGITHVFVQAESRVGLDHGFNRNSIDHWCGLILAGAIIFATLVDWLAHLADWVCDAAAKTKRRLEYAGLRPSLKVLARLELGMIPAVCEAKKVACCASVGQPRFFSLSAEQRRHVLSLVLAHLSLRRAEVTHTSMDVLSIFEALRRLQRLALYSSLQTHAFTSAHPPAQVGSPVELRIPVQELDARSGTISLRPPVSAWAVARRQNIHASTLSSTRKAKSSKGLARMMSTHRPTHACCYPAARLGPAAPLLFSILSFMLLSCMFAEHDTDASPLHYISGIAETIDEDTVPTPLDLVLRSSPFPAPSSLRPSVRKGTGVLELTSTPIRGLLVGPVSVSALTADRRKEVINLVLATQQARTSKPVYALPEMNLAYLFRRSIYLSPNPSTRMGVSMPLLTSTVCPPVQPEGCAQNSASARLRIKYHLEQESGDSDNVELKVDSKTETEAEIGQRPPIARKTQRAPKFAAYVPPAFRNALAGSHTASREAAIESSRTSALQRRDRDPQETQDARRGDPEARLGFSSPAPADLTLDEIGEGTEGPTKKRTRRGKRAGRPRGLKEVELESEAALEL